MIHPTAIVHPHARLAPDVEVGPYAIIGEHVEIGAGTSVGPHTVIHGHTTIGRDNRIFQFVSLGEVPQDKKYDNEPTRLEIGDRNTIREFCTLNIGTAQDVGVTRLGNDNWIMAYVHLAHDCQVGDHTIFANHATLAGHVTVGDYAILGGFAAVHQFCHIGAHAMLGINSLITQDVPPYVTCGGQPTAPHGINAEGLRRRGFSSTAIQAIKQAYKTLYKSGLSFNEARAALATAADQQPELRLLSDFLAQSARGIIR